MYPQTSLYFYKFRFLVAGFLAVVFFLTISAVVTAVGSNTILDTKTHPSADVISTPSSAGPNVVTAGASELDTGLARAALSVGTGIYGACRSVSNTSAASGRMVAHGSAVIVGGIWDGTAFVGRGVGSIAYHSLHAAGTGVMFTLRIPGKIVGSIGSGSGHTVSALITTPDSKPTPVISDETSSEVVARLSAEQQQQISKLIAGQIVANQSMDGTILAGDPSHGGYPTKWDNYAQDSTLDSWGMYNRECVSYAAWKVYQTYGHMPYWGGVGNANEWVGDARRAGIPTGYTPQVHSVAIWRVGYYGHAMWVEKVSGNMIYVSQYNYDLHGHYSEMWVRADRFTYIYFH